MAEKFNIVKLLSSPFTGMYWVKSTMIGLGVFMIAFTGFGLYKAYIKKPDPTTEQKAEKIINYNSSPKSTFGCSSTRYYRKHPVNGVKL